MLQQERQGVEGELREEDAACHPGLGLGLGSGLSLGLGLGLGSGLGRRGLAPRAARHQAGCAREGGRVCGVVVQFGLGGIGRAPVSEKWMRVESWCRRMPAAAPAHVPSNCSITGTPASSASGASRRSRLRYGSAHGWRSCSATLRSTHRAPGRPGCAFSRAAHVLSSCRQLSVRFESHASCGADKV